MPGSPTLKNDQRPALPPRAIEIDRDELEELASLGCTQLEAATWFGLAEKEFRTMLKDAALRRIWRRGKGMGRIRIRRAQFNLAEKNATMAILLGRRYLGQREEPQGENAGQITVVVDTGIARDGG